jgi:hypothetical protein
VDAVAERLADVDGLDRPDETTHRRVASLAALATVGVDAAVARASDAVEAALRPHVGGPVETVEGYADVLECSAREAPGVALALALGHDGAVEPALDAWRTHGARAHESLRAADTGRYDGLSVFRDAAGGMPVATVARMAVRYRSPEPLALAVTDGRAALAGANGRDGFEPLAAAADALGGTATRLGPVSWATFDDERAAFVLAVREALQ